MKTKEWKRCVFLLILFMLLLMLAMFYGFTFIEGNTQFAAADEVFPTYELKILMNDGQYYWVAKDSCDANEGCNAKEECKILSSTPVKLTVNSPFNLCQNSKMVSATQKECIFLNLPLLQIIKHVYLHQMWFCI